MYCLVCELTGEPENVQYHSAQGVIANLTDLGIYPSLNEFPFKYYNPFEWFNWFITTAPLASKCGFTIAKFCIFHFQISSVEWKLTATNVKQLYGYSNGFHQILHAALLAWRILIQHLKLVHQALVLYQNYTDSHSLITIVCTINVITECRRWLIYAEEPQDKENGIKLPFPEPVDHG